MIEIASKRAKLEAILAKFVEVGDVEGVAVVTRDGLLVASILPRDVDSGVLSAMSAAMHAAGETAIKELKKGSCQVVSAESEQNIVIAYSLDPIRSPPPRKSSKSGIFVGVVLSVKLFWSLPGFVD